MPKYFKPNHRGLAAMAREIEQELAKYPVKVPLHASLDQTQLQAGDSMDHDVPGFDTVPEHTMLRRAALDATMVLLLELEERGPDERGLDPRHQFVDAHLHHLDEPLQSWASENSTDLTRELLLRGYLQRSQGGLGGQVSAHLSDTGRSHAIRLRRVQSGRARHIMICERVLSLVGHANAEGRSRVDPADLKDTAHAWLAGARVTDEEANRAGEVLLRRGLIAAFETDQGWVSHARLTAEGAAVVDTFGGSISAWERSKVQGGTLMGDQINISNSAGVQLSTRTSGTVHQSATTQVSSAPDLTDLCTRIRELAPTLDLDEQDQQELLDQVGRLEGAADKPEAQIKGVKRWLNNIKDLLTSDSTGKALGLLAKIGSAIHYFTKNSEESPSTA